ncbi:allergen Cr-PI-like [Lycorma delicatula]|uniref:allergen Cr-PI-like n=1 Tax=Lycorma delicatula TaxID=130591 RepID=UPI003F517E51
MKPIAILLFIFLGLCKADSYHRINGPVHNFIRNFKGKYNSTYENVSHHSSEYDKDSYDSVTSNNQNQYAADKHFLEKQRFVLQLLSYQQHDDFNQLSDEEIKFDYFYNNSNFNNQPAVKKFLKNYYNGNFLPDDEIFSTTTEHHENQAAQLFYFFYSAKNWNTFKQATSWAKGKFNSRLFYYSFIAAVLNHPITQGIVIPPLYEIFPHAFVPATALYKIYRAKILGYQHTDVYANYTNQNKYNNNYHSNNNKSGFYKRNYNNKNDLFGNKSNGSHNANYVYAEDDGSHYSNAGIPEDPENRLRYFSEDIGINAFHAGFHVQNPSFFGANNKNNYFTSDSDSDLHFDSYDYNDQDMERGEAFQFSHQQFYARYVLERFSNDLPVPEPINFNGKIKTAYNPNIQYENGQAVPARPPNTKFWKQQNNNIKNNNNARQPNNYQALLPQVYEQRIQKVVGSGYALNKNGTRFNIKGLNGIGLLGNLAGFPASSPHPDYYGNYFSAALNAIGNIVDPYNQYGVAPGSAANYALMARDPAYYQFLAKFNQIFYDFQNNQGPYSQSQLDFPGVEIESFDVSNLMTRFETFTMNVNNAVYYRKNENYHTDNQRKKTENFSVKFQRLTSQPFTYKMTFNSYKPTAAVVRIFIGPKYNSNGQLFTLPQASQYYVQLDQFRVQLNKGKNIIDRNSQQSQIYVHDQPSFQQLWSQLEQAEQGVKPFFVQKAESRHCGFPRRAQLPKGKRGGQQFVFYVIINDADEKPSKSYENDSFNNNTYYYNRQFQSFYCGGNNYNQFHDKRSLGFPFDRPIQDAYYNTANQYFKTVTIYHLQDDS